MIYHLNMYVYIYMYMYAYIYIYIYTYVCKCYIDNAGSQNLKPTPGPMVSNELRLFFSEPTQFEWETRRPLRTKSWSRLTMLHLDWALVINPLASICIPLWISLWDGWPGRVWCEIQSVMLFCQATLIRISLQIWGMTYLDYDVYTYKKPLGAPKRV
jgi:hypothetical protein